MNWQSIETAPREDGNRVLVAYPVREAGVLYVEEVYWDESRKEWWPSNQHWTDSYGEAVYPTHWMLLPEPPK